MSEIEIILPKMGESVAEATITKWLKNEGEFIQEDEAIVEIATDKVDSEVPSPSSGILGKILVQEGDVAQVGQSIGIITSKESASTEKEKQNAPSPSESHAAPIAVKEIPFVPENKPTGTIAQNSIPLPRNDDNGKFYSPLVRKIAETEGISAHQLENIQGSGTMGRITKNDLLNFIETNANTTTKNPPSTEATPANNTISAVTAKAPVQTTIEDNDSVEIIEMDRMRKLIAEHMVMSKHTSPHVTSFVEADVTNIVNWREKIKDTFQKREGQKITVTPIFIEAVVKALQDFPLVNASVNGSQIIRKKHLNIGIATALPSGNLIVPVIKQAENMNLVGLTKTTNALVSKARNNKLAPDDVQGGTFTITNVGTFGNLMGTPIINQPQVAILATGAIKKKPVVVETQQGDYIGIRHMMFLSLSYDHRVVDGALGGSFLRKIADYLEQFDYQRTI